MRKLLLASFSFKIDEIPAQEHRLVVIEIAPNEKPHMEAITARAKHWFHEVRPAIDLTGVVVYDSIDMTLPDTEKAMEPSIYGRTAYSLDELPKLHKDGMSQAVVVDMDGWRKNFQIAHYDFDNNEWVFHEEDISLLDNIHAKWIDLLPHAG